MLARAAVGLVLALPVEALAIAACLALGLDAGQVGSWLSQPSVELLPLGWVTAALVLSVPLTLAWTAVVMRLLGAVKPGTIDRFSTAYIRVWLKTGLLNGAVDWLGGSLVWSWWLRAAGMRLGRGCEISTITDVVPELVEIGPGSFLAGGIYVGDPRIQQGRVTLARTVLGSDTFLGNHVVVPTGQKLPPGTLLLNMFPRATGMKTGRLVVLGPGFAQVVDPDMLVIEDGATVNARFQAHTFEDRVLKIDRMHVRRHASRGSGTVPLYGADIGAGTHVAPHSVVMKREGLAAGLRCQGAPTKVAPFTA